MSVTSGSFALDDPKDPNIGEPLSVFREKNKAVSFDPADPMFEKLRSKLRASIRFEIEEGSLAAIEKYIRGSASLPSDVYDFIRPILAEYHMDQFSPPDGVGKNLLIRRRPANQNVLFLFILDLDMAMRYCHEELQKKRQESQPRFENDGHAGRLQYLTQLSRHFHVILLNENFEDIAERALLYVAWTRDARAVKVLEEAKARIQNDIILLTVGGDGIRNVYERNIKRIDRLIELNKRLVKSGFAAALADLPGMRDSSTVIDALFAEYVFHPQEASTIAIEALKAMSKKYDESSSDDERNSLVTRAKEVVEAYRKHGDLKIDIAKEAFGVPCFDEAMPQDDWVRKAFRGGK